jgi:D-alanine-D-alanine ligase
MTTKKRVGILAGGKSPEHEVSLASARSVLRAIDREKYDVVVLGIDHHGRWLTSGDALAQLAAGGTVDAGTGPDAEPRRELVPGAGERGIPQLDVVFPVLHGQYGEDGTVQGLLEVAGIPYVGAGVLASAVGMDKSASRLIFAQVGLPQVAYVAALRKEWESTPQDLIQRIELALTYPVFVKPANLGSSIGISKARNREELRASLNEAAQYDRKLLIEQAVPNAREIECSVLGNDDPVASVPGEVRPSNEFYDYNAKYIDGKSELLIPAPLPARTSAQVRELAVKAFKALDCAGMARVDFLINSATNEIYLNEINTLPGFTSISMYPKLWEASGISYRELIDRLIDLALERHADAQRSVTTFGGAMAASA